MEAGLTKAAIEKIEQLVEAKEMTKVIDEKTYSRYDLKRIYADPRPSDLKLSTLDGIADYINENLDGVDPEGCMVVIDEVDQVSIWAQVQGEKNDRHLIARARLTDVENFRFGSWLDQESFIISFSALFCQTEDKAKIISAASNMQVIDQTAGEDTGATVNRAASNQVLTPGIDEADMPKTVVKLKPYRTFRAIEQPESAFIFRYKSHQGHPIIALFEADGGAWKLEAKSRIKKFLSEKVKSPIIC